MLDNGFPILHIGGTKKAELIRTLGVCREILEREGVNERGLYFLLFFLRDQGRPIEDLTDLLEERRIKNAR